MSEKRVNQALYDLQFNVAQLLKQATGATRRYEIKTELDDLGEDFDIVSPLTGFVKFLRTGPNILVTGELQISLQKVCGRCLTTFTEPISIELEELFYPAVDIVSGAILAEPDDADPANRIDTQNILSLMEVIRQELIVISDGILYCRPDCKGLCPQCGQDRNVASCDCQEQAIDPRWAGLQALELEE